MEKKSNQESQKIAGKFYETKDYNGQDELSSGLAMTHEQASDDYMEGTIDAMFSENVDESKHAPKKGQS